MQGPGKFESNTRRPLESKVVPGRCELLAIAAFAAMTSGTPSAAHTAFSGLAALAGFATVPTVTPLTRHSTLIGCLPGR